MDDLRLRVWDKVENEMAGTFRLNDISAGGAVTCCSRCVVDLKDCVVMRHAESRDNEVFEGDIIGYHDTEHPYCEPKYVVGVVRFGEFTIDTGCAGHGMGNGSENIVGFYVEDKYGTKRGSILKSKYESVIGNIYENKDLLTKEVGDGQTKNIKN